MNSFRANPDSRGKEINSEFVATFTASHVFSMIAEEK